MLNKSVVEVLVQSVYLLAFHQTTNIIKITSEKVARTATIQSNILRQDTVKRAKGIKNSKGIEKNN